LIGGAAARSVAREQMRERYPGSAATPAVRERPDGRPARAPQAAAARILALQRTAGNAAVCRMLARAPKQWENPEVLKVVYPGREAQLRKYVAMFREIEQIEAKDPAAKKKTLKEISDAANALSGADLANEVERLLKSSITPEWMRDIVRDYAGMRYYRDYAKKSGSSAHGSYYNPARLLYIIKRESGDWLKAREEQAKADLAKRTDAWKTKGSKGKAPELPKKLDTVSDLEKQWLAKSSEEAMSRLEQIRNDKNAGIPDWAWHKIVRLTPLRAKHAVARWEDESLEKPDPTDIFWGRVMKAWTGDERIGNLAYGSTGWRSDLLKDDKLITTVMVCNELSEATQRKRGIKLPGGIHANAEFFSKAAEEGAKAGARPEVQGAYFRRPTSLADFRPGAALFWINTATWKRDTKEKTVDRSNKVHKFSGVDYPMPFVPEFVDAWAAWSTSAEGKQYKKDKTAYDNALKAWNAEAAKAKKKDLPEPANKPEEPKDTQPENTTPKALPSHGDVVDGWKYTVSDGQPITREKDGVVYYMVWLHQATVIRAVDNNRVFVLETTNTEESGGAAVSASGFTTRSPKELMANPGVFIGYAPGTVDPPLAPPAPPPVVIPPELILTPDVPQQSTPVPVP
jgi:hypothetical protein